MCGFAETLGRSQLCDEITGSRVSFIKPKLTFYLFLAVRIASLHTRNLRCALVGFDACYYFAVQKIHSFNENFPHPMRLVLD